MTKADPFHTTTTLDAVMPGAPTAAVTGLRKVPGYGAPSRRVIAIPKPALALKPGIRVTSARSGAVMVTCTHTGRAPGGTVMVRVARPMATGPRAAPVGQMVP